MQTVEGEDGLCEMCVRNGNLYRSSTSCESDGLLDWGGDFPNIRREDHASEEDDNETDEGEIDLKGCWFAGINSWIILEREEFTGNWKKIWWTEEQKSGGRVEHVSSCEENFFMTTHKVQNYLQDADASVLVNKPQNIKPQKHKAVGKNIQK